MPKYVTLPSLLLKQVHSLLIGSLSDDPGSGLASVFVSVASIEVLAVCSFHQGYLFFARSTVGGEIKWLRTGRTLPSDWFAIDFIGEYQGGWFHKDSFPQADSGASPVDFKLHHYPAYIQLEKLPIGR